MIYMIHKPTGKIERNREPKFDIKDFKRNNEFKYLQLYETLRAERINVSLWEVHSEFEKEYENWISERIIDDMTNCYRESIS